MGLKSNQLDSRQNSVGLPMTEGKKRERKADGGKRGTTLNRQAERTDRQNPEPSRQTVSGVGERKAIMTFRNSIPSPLIVSLATRDREMGANCLRDGGGCTVVG